MKNSFREKTKKVGTKCQNTLNQTKTRNILHKNIATKKIFQNKNNKLVILFLGV